MFFSLEKETTFDGILFIWDSLRDTICRSNDETISSASPSSPIIITGGSHRCDKFALIARLHT
jgi:hypothetical protein